MPHTTPHSRTTYPGVVQGDYGLDDLITSESHVAADAPRGGVAREDNLPSEVCASLIRELLVSDGSASVRVRGKSMLPTLREGDLVTLEPLETDALPGDLVVFERGPCLCVHRVLAVRFDSRTRRASAYLTAGDGLRHDDGYQSAGSIIGRVVGVRGQSGQWSPVTLPRRAHSALRVLLGLHPALRARLASGKAAFRVREGVLKRFDGGGARP